jgi:hypothetical protein
MLKKVSKIATLFCLLAFAGSSFAQTAETPEYPQYGFWSNWGIGINGSFMFEPDVKQFYGNENLYWGGGYNAGLGIILQKEDPTGKKSRLAAGSVVTILNSLDDKPISERDINYGFYYDECFKIINPIKLGISPKGKGKTACKKYFGMYNSLFDNEEC